MLLSPSLHSQCAVVLSHNGIAEVLGLAEFVVNTTSHNHKRAYNDRSSIGTSRISMTRRTYLPKNTYHNIKSYPSLNLTIIIFMVFSNP
jgi:hypothetical protein